MSKMLLKQKSGENQWERLMLSNMTVSVPSSWTNSVTETSGATGQSDINITSIAAGITPPTSVYWSLDTGIPCSSDLSFSFFIELVNSTVGAGGYGSAQADACFFFLGITSDTANMATRGSFIGYEHDGAVQPRGVSYQGSNSFSAGNAQSRHVRGTFMSPKNLVKSPPSGYTMYSFSKAPFNLPININSELTPAATTDTIKIVFAAGINKVGSYNIPIRLWYVIGDQLTLS